MFLQYFLNNWYSANRHGDPSKMLVRPELSNPFNPNTVINFSISREGSVSIVIFDAAVEKLKS